MYLQRLGPSAAVNTVEEFRALPTQLGMTDAPYLGEDGDLFGPGGLLEPPADDLAYLAAVANPTAVPDLSAYVDYRNEYIRVFREVMEANDLDAIVFPQAPEEYPGVFSEQMISQTASGMNTANFPGVVVPAGAYESGTPFALLFVGDLWTEGQLLSFAYDYEQATHHRIVPTLVTEPYPNIPNPIPLER